MIVLVAVGTLSISVVAVVVAVAAAAAPRTISTATTTLNFLPKLADDDVFESRSGSYTGSGGDWWMLRCLVVTLIAKVIGQGRSIRTASLQAAASRSVSDNR